MSTVYEAKIRTTVKYSATPLLHDFLNRAINSTEDPTAEFFEKFNKSESAELAFNFIRYSRPPEFVWSEPYSDWDKEDIARSWHKHSAHNKNDAEAIKARVNTLKSKLLGVLPYKTEVNLSKLPEIIEVYAETSFVDGCFFFSNEYSSNDSFSFERLVEFLNANRDSEERMITAFENDNQVMPQVYLHINDGEIELFKGAYETDSCSNHNIQYDRNGFFCGEYNDRTENHFATNEYSFIPPNELKYKINWMNEDDVTMVRSGFERYSA